MNAWSIPENITRILVQIHIQDYYGEGWASYEPSINILPICDTMEITPEKDGIELLTLFTVNMHGCRDEDGIILEYKYVYYTHENDINDLEYKSNPLTEYALSPFTFFVLPQGKIYIQVLIRD